MFLKNYSYFHVETFNNENILSCLGYKVTDLHDYDNDVQFKSLLFANGL